MVIYRNVTDGLLYSFRWVQERIADPATSYAIAYGHLGKTIRSPDRMDFVTLSPEALRRPIIPPVDPATAPPTVEE